MFDKLADIRSFIINNGFKGIQAFCSRNILGDRMLTVYNVDDVVIDYCEDYQYIEIFGLTCDEYFSLRDILDISD